MTNQISALKCKKEEISKRKCVCNADAFKSIIEYIGLRTPDMSNGVLKHIARIRSNESQDVSFKEREEKRVRLFARLSSQCNSYIIT